MVGSFELFKTKNDKFMFNLKAGNGQIILTGQMYDAKASALQGIESVRLNATLDERFERAMSQSDEPYFNLKAANGQVVGRSQTYSSNSAMENGINSVKANAPQAQLIDITM